ncbi:MAG: diguanylate cyclase [Humidesulfovibrio sp.]|nr:diguanylate cyclase [Humidesulfovibrio sp.]
MTYKLSDLIDRRELQLMAEACHKACGVAVSIKDAGDDRVLAGAGWQVICAGFHRLHPKSRERCILSRARLRVSGLDAFVQDELCQNGLRHLAIPMLVEGQHLGTYYLTQFLYDTDLGDHERFAAQALEFGYEAQEYLNALDEVPVLSRERAKEIVSYVGTFSRLIADLATRNLRLKLALEENKHIQARLRDSQERYRFLAENSADIIWRLDADHRFVYASPADERTRGFHYTETLGQSLWDAMPPDLVDHMQKRCREYLLSIKDNPDPAPMRVEAQLLHKNGGKLWAEILSTPVREDDGTVTGYHLVARDITKRKAYEEQLVFLSTHDTLTGLYNRAHFEAEFQRAAQGRLLPVSVIIADVDGLKTVNDNLGHAAGDELIKDAANILRKAFRSGDLVARLGGDEFAVLLPGADEAAVGLSQKRVFAEMENVRHRPTPFPVRLSLGAATARTAKEMENVQREADQRMYEDKSAHKTAQP